MDHVGTAALGCPAEQSEAARPRNPPWAEAKGIRWPRPCVAKRQHSIAPR